MEKKYNKLKQNYDKLVESYKTLSEIQELNNEKINKYKFYAILGWSILLFFCSTVLILFML